MAGDPTFWISCSLLPGIGPARLRLLAAYFNGDMERAWGAGLAEWLRAGLERKTASTALAARSTVRVEPVLERMRLNHIALRVVGDPDYPARLAEIDDAPPLLFERGRLLPEDAWAVAVVGTRHPTAYGREVTAALVRSLVTHNVTVVSGLARGVDGVAHKAAIEAGGRTIAVMPCGLDRVYPPEHAPLAREIVADGVMLSEYPAGVGPEAGHFPARNRLISGLAVATVVVEAGERSGALITARWALDQNREVYAVPGSILSPASCGTNRLIRDLGAKLLANLDDVVADLRPQVAPRVAETRQLLPTTLEESRILEVINVLPLHVDEMARHLSIPVAEVTGTLATMELKGLVRPCGPMQYVREA